MSDTVKVVLGDDYYKDEYWYEYDPQQCRADEPYEIPIEQRDRWQAAMDAYGQMQSEIAQVMEARREQKRAERERSERNAATWRPDTP